MNPTTVKKLMFSTQMNGRHETVRLLSARLGLLSGELVDTRFIGFVRLNIVMMIMKKLMIVTTTVVVIVIMMSMTVTGR